MALSKSGSNPAVSTERRTRALIKVKVENYVPDRVTLIRVLVPRFFIGEFAEADRELLKNDPNVEGVSIGERVNIQA